MRRKASGKPIKVAEREEKPDNVVNLMDALKASLKGKSAAKRRAAGAAPGTGTTGGEEGAPVGGEAAQGGVRFSQPSWPGLTRPSTTCFLSRARNVDARDKPGHDGVRGACAPTASTSSLRFLRRLALLRSLLRHLLALGPRLGQADRNRLLAALDLRPERPLFNVPALRFFIARSTSVGCLL